jgi:aspartokinase-like uncharacterized kinase
MWVVKLGGSLLNSPELKRWLQLFAQYGDGQIVIVPGGGIFADAVREAQQRSRCSNAAAHRMAVMAMDQYGVLLADLNPMLVTANSELEIAERGWQHRAIVWLPSAMVLTDDTIPMSWQMTSDSLAAWLAIKLNASHLVLVKSQRPPGLMTSAAILSQQGVVDECLGDYIAEQSFETWVVGKQDFTAFEQGLSPDVLKRTGLKIQPN